MLAVFLSMNGAAAIVEVHFVVCLFVVVVFYLLDVFMMMSIAQTQMHRISEIQMQTCGFCLLPCYYTACYACHHCHLY